MLYNEEEPETLHVFKFTIAEVNALYASIDPEAECLTPEDKILVQTIEDKLYSI